jgi:hypothetical protein
MADFQYTAGRPHTRVRPPDLRPPRRLFLEDVAAALRDLGLTDDPMKCPPGRTFNRDFRIDDYRQARELAAIVCGSPKSIDRFVRFCEQQAEDFLKPYINLIVALVPVLRVKRTMTGQAADRAIAIILWHFDRSAELERRRDCER